MALNTKFSVIIEVKKDFHVVFAILFSFFSVKIISFREVSVDELREIFW